MAKRPSGYSRAQVGRPDGQDLMTLCDDCGRCECENTVRDAKQRSDMTRLCSLKTGGLLSLCPRKPQPAPGGAVVVPGRRRRPRARHGRP